MSTTEHQLFAQRVDRLKSSFGLKQEEIAKAIDVHPSHISRLRNGKAPITEKSWKRLSDLEKKHQLDVSTNPPATVIGWSPRSGAREIKDGEPVPSHVQILVEREVAKAIRGYCDLYGGSVDEVAERWLKERIQKEREDYARRKKGEI